jgi:hypothetical protein
MLITGIIPFDEVIVRFDEVAKILLTEKRRNTKRQLQLNGFG